MPLMFVPPAATEAAARLHAAGFAAVIVGGAVRDSLLGRPAKDWDLATSATPEQVLRVFPRASVTTRFGTTLVPSSDGLLEVTTFRSEADYADYRRPSTIAFTTDLSQDLARRDFTINAMAYDPVTDTLLDPFGGRGDLAIGQLRAVGVAGERFGEDALRLLRAIRFAATLGFTLENATAAAAARQAPLTRHLAAERVGMELARVVSAAYPGPALVKAAQLGLLEAFVPGLNAPTGALRHGAIVLEAMGPGVGPVERLAALTHHARTTASDAASATFERFLSLALGEDTARNASSIIAATGLGLALRGADLIKAMRPWAPEELAASLRVRYACELATRGHGSAALAAFGEELGRVVALGLPRMPTELAVGGADLLALGLKPGPRFGAILRELLDAVAEGQVPNQREPLLIALRTAAAR